MGFLKLLVDQKAFFHFLMNKIVNNRQKVLNNCFHQRKIPLQFLQPKMIILKSFCFSAFKKARLADALFIQFCDIMPFKHLNM